MAFPFDPTFRVLLELLKAAIEHDQPEGRGQLARVVRVLPLVCRECRDLARGDPSVGFVMAYCAYLYQSGARERYCDALPESVDPARIAHAITNARRRELIHMSDLLEARSLKAQEIDKSAAQVAGPAIPTIPLNLPHKVKLFAWYLGQWHAEFLCNPKFPNHYKTCQRKGCTRPAMVPINEQFSAWDATQDASFSEATYWRMCHTGSMSGLDERRPINMAFCSRSCYCAVEREYGPNIDLLVHLTKFTDGSASTKRLRNDSAKMTSSRLYRNALARNVSLARSKRLKMYEHTQTEHYPLTLDDGRAMQRAFVDALNIDLGVLHAAAVVCELPARLRSNVALPDSENWRAEHYLYTNAVRKVRAIYKSTCHGPHRGIAKGSEPWLEKVKTMCLQIFN